MGNQSAQTQAQKFGCNQSHTEQPFAKVWSLRLIATGQTKQLERGQPHATARNTTRNRWQCALQTRSCTTGRVSHVSASGSVSGTNRPSEAKPKLRLADSDTTDQPTQPASNLATRVGNAAHSVPTRRARLVKQQSAIDRGWMAQLSRFPNFDSTVLVLKLLPMSETQASQTGLFARFHPNQDLSNQCCYAPECWHTSSPKHSDHESAIGFAVRQSPGWEVKTSF